MTAPTSTLHEERIAQHYASVLADVSRCAQAVRDGDWRSLVTIGEDLSRGATELTEAAGDLPHRGTQPRAHVVADLVARHTRESAAAGPPDAVRQAAVVKTTMTDPFTHPGSAVR